MEKFKSLYDDLLEKGLIEPEPPRVDSQTPTLRDRVSLSGKAFSEAVLASDEFKLYIVEGINERNLPPAILLRLMDHGWGKPVERLEVKDTTVSDLDGLSPSQLRARLNDRIRSLSTLVELIDDEEPSAEGSVH